MKDCLLLSEVQAVFAFRDFRQTRYFLDKHRGQIRQFRRGQRRYANVSDVARAILSDPPNRELDDDREELLRQARLGERLQREAALWSPLVKRFHEQKGLTNQFKRFVEVELNNASFQ